MNSDQNGIHIAILTFTMLDLQFRCHIAEVSIPLTHHSTWKESVETESSKPARPYITKCGQSSSFAADAGLVLNKQIEVICGDGSHQLSLLTALMLKVWSPQASPLSWHAI